MDELSLSDYLSIIKRRHKVLLATIAIILCFSVLLAYRWSNYRSTATVAVEQPEVPATMTTPAGVSANDMTQAFADLRISQIHQKVLSTGSLAEIIAKFNLYAKARENTPIAAVAEGMRKKIKLNLVSTSLASPAAAQKASAGQLSAIAFVLTFDYSDPLVAQQVTNEIVTRFLDEDLKIRRNQAKETSALLDSQIEALEKNLAEQEKSIAEFRSKHGDTRPEALIFNQQTAVSTAMSIQSLNAQITTNEGSQGALRAQLAVVEPYSRVLANGQILTTPSIQLKALESQYASLSAQYGPDHPDVVKTKNQIDALRPQVHKRAYPTTAPLKAKIQDMKTKLTIAEKNYGPENPEVESLKSQISKLEEQLKNKPLDASSGFIKEDADNPAYLQLVAQLRTAEEQYKSLVTQRDTLIEQQNKYLQAVAANPAVEQELAALTRDYDNAQLRYRDLRQKKMAADMREQMEEDRKGQRLTVINPPELPLGTTPPRRLILLGGALLSVMAGIGSVIAAQIIGQSVVGPRHLASLAGISPLAVIPHIYTLDEKRRARARKRNMAIGVLLLCALALFVFSFVIMPFDVLWSVVTRRIGLS